jgi:integrase
MSDAIARSLSDSTVRNAKPKPKPYKLTDGGGLFLMVQPTGAKLWRYKYRLSGKEGLYSLGAYPDVTLSAARDLHRAARAQVAAGVNPGQARQVERAKAVQAEKLAQAGAFPTVLQAWRDVTDPKLAAMSLRQRDREIKKHLVPAFRAKNIDAITRADIAALLKKVEARAPEVARNLRTYLFGIFEHACDLGMVDINPVPPRRVLRPRQSVSHAAMPVDRLPAFLSMLDGCQVNLETRTAMWLTILTACRKNEATGASWAEFDLDAAEWTIPAHRMKARREHWVPLPHQAVTILRQLREYSRMPLLFPNRRDPSRPMAERSLNALMERNGYHGDTVHGFRSVFSTHFNAKEGVNPDVVERCLAHAPADKVRAAYNRHQYKAERRAMLQEWADWLDALRARNVVQIQQHSAAA